MRDCGRRKLLGEKWVKRWTRERGALSNHPKRREREREKKLYFDEKWQHQSKADCLHQKDNRVKSNNFERHSSERCTKGKKHQTQKENQRLSPSLPAKWWFSSGEISLYVVALSERVLISNCANQAKYAIRQFKVPNEIRLRLKKEQTRMEKHKCQSGQMR